MRCIRCEKNCQTVSGGCCGGHNFGNYCDVCGSSDLYIKCDSGGGCGEFLFWGILAVATFGLALIIPLILYEGGRGRECAVVCRRCGHIQKVGYVNDL